MKDIMRSVNIINEEVLQSLNDFKDMWWDKRNNLEDYYNLFAKDSKVEDYLSDDYKKHIMNMGPAHGGYPEKIKGFLLKQESHSATHDVDLATKYRTLNEKLQLLLSTKNNALCAVYPPGGFISWHNNANASAYNLIFSWSENGDGYWKHVDPYTNKDVHVQDVPGWQCKAFYFGGYEDSPEDIVYHAAATNCWRMTISYIFDRESKEFWEDVIEEIEME